MGIFDIIKKSKKAKFITNTFDEVRNDFALQLKIEIENEIEIKIKSS